MGCDEIRDLGQAENRYEQRAGVRLQQVNADVVIGIVLVDRRDEWPGIDYERDSRNSASMRRGRISSCRSDRYPGPFKEPASDIRIGRRVPRRPSSAWRVISLIVRPVRCASWRRRRSRSSEILTVVRFMICQHTRSRHASHGRLGREGAEAARRVLAKLDNDRDLLLAPEEEQLVGTRVVLDLVRLVEPALVEQGAKSRLGLLRGRWLVQLVHAREPAGRKLTGGSRTCRLCAKRRSTSDPGTRSPRVSGFVCGIRTQMRKP